MTITPITSSGNIHSAAISGDGKWLAYVQDDKGGHALWVHQLGTGSTAQVLPGTQQEIAGLTFSIDGNYLYLVKRDESIGLGTLFQVSVIGRHADPAGCGRRQSRLVSRRMASGSYSYANQADENVQLIIANADGNR